MKLIVTKDYHSLSKEAANIIIKQIQKNPNSILGLATGGTPVETYQNLVEATKRNLISWKKIKTFNLDEYATLPQNHELSYWTFMKENLFNHIDIEQSNTYLPLNTGDLKKNGQQYDLDIEKAGGIDLQLLGIGENAHIAFNEPGSKLADGTREVTLTDSTIQANARYFAKPEDVPKTAISMGLSTILKAKTILLLASGINKSLAIKNTLEGQVTEDVPASWLQNHHDVIIIADEDACSLLKPETIQNLK